MQRPLATVVVGGLLSTLSLTLLTLPSLCYLMNRRREEPHDEGGVRYPDELPPDGVDPTAPPQKQFWLTETRSAMRD